MTKRFNSVHAGIFFAIIAEVTYGLNPLFALPMYAKGMDPDSVLTMRYIPSCICIGLWMLLKKQDFHLTKKEFWLCAVEGILFATCSLTLFQSYRLMDAGVASTILFVYPGMVAVIMAIFFRERMPPVTWLALFLSFAGIVLLYYKEDGTVLNLTGVILVLLSALTYAVYLVIINTSSLKSMPALKLTFYSLIFCAAVFFARLRCGLDFHFSPAPIVFVCAAGLVIFPTIISLVFTTLAVIRIGATTASILGALEPLTAVFIGVLVFHEEMTVRIAAGIILILAAVVITAVIKCRQEKLQSGGTAA